MMQSLTLELKPQFVKDGDFTYTVTIYNYIERWRLSNNHQHSTTQLKWHIP